MMKRANRNTSPLTILFIVFTSYFILYFIKDTNIKLPEYQVEVFYCDPKKIFILYNESAIPIEETLHYINSKPVSFYNPEDLTKYLYLDMKKEDLQWYASNLLTPHKYYNTSIYTLWGMFVKRNGTMFHQSTMYKQSFMQFENQTAVFAGFYDEVISLGSVHSCGNWGHSLQDFFHTLFIFPQEIIQRSMIIPGFIPCFREILDMYNISEKQIINMKWGDCIYCSIVHTLSPSGYISCYSVFSMKLKNALFKKYRLDLCNPHLYCFINRNKDSFRHIKNFDEIFNYTVKQYPNISFVKIIDNIPTVKDTAMQYAQIKFLFGPTGSNLVKTCFMQNNSVIVSAGSSDYFGYYDDSVICFTVFTHVFFLQFKSPLKHFVRAVTNVSVDLCFKFIQKGIYCSLNGHWPEFPL